MSNVVKFSDVISKMMEAATLDNKGEMKILDEDAMNEADQMINTMIVEKARDWWAKLESAEDSLADMSDEINFADLNADPSHVGSPAMGLDTDDGQAPASLESMLEGSDFDLRSIFEEDDDDDEEDIEENMHYEDDEELGPEDGDDNFDDLMRGDDVDGLGDDGVDGDLDMGDDMDAIGGEDDGIAGDDLGGDFDFTFLDDEGGNAEFGGGDEFGAEDEFGGDDEFGAEVGDEFGGEDEFGAEDDMEENSFRESDDEDDDDDDDKKGDDED